MKMDTIEYRTGETFDPVLSRPAGVNPPESGRWPLERVLFALAGTMTLLSVLLTVAVSNWFLLLTAFVGVNQWLHVVVGACPASVVLRRTCRLRSAMYPNRDAAARRGEVTV